MSRSYILYREHGPVYTTREVFMYANQMASNLSILGLDASTVTEDQVTNTIRDLLNKITDREDRIRNEDVFRYMMDEIDEEMGWDVSDEGGGEEEEKLESEEGTKDVPSSKEENVHKQSEENEDENVDEKADDHHLSPSPESKASEVDSSPEDTRIRLSDIVDTLESEKDSCHIIPRYVTKKSDLYRDEEHMELLKAECLKRNISDVNWDILSRYKAPRERLTKHLYDKLMQEDPWYVMTSDDPNDPIVDEHWRTGKKEKMQYKEWSRLNDMREKPYNMGNVSKSAQACRFAFPLGWRKSKAQEYWYLCRPKESPLPRKRVRSQDKSLDPGDYSEYE